MKVLLFGNPNVGKTTLFNALCQDNQQVGNWSGTTTQVKQSHYFYKNQKYQVADIPGIYDLFANKEDKAQEISKDYILNEQYDLIVNVVDITNLNTNLSLSIDLLNLKIPTILVINMADKEKSHRVLVNLNKLQVLLGIKVIKISANRGIGVEDLKHLIASCSVNYKVGDTKIWYNSTILKDISHNDDKNFLFNYFKDLKFNNNKLFTNAKKDLLQNIHTSAIFTNNNKATLSEKIDNILLHKYLGIPLFIFIMYVMFSTAIKVGGIFQDFFDSIGSLFFIDFFKYSMDKLAIPMEITNIVVNGIGGGLLTVFTFIPVLFVFFICVSILQQSGYMSRVVFLTNSIMSKMGLNGKSLIPMLMGLGCTIPSVMSSRIIANENQRRLTMLSSHFLSCGARLSVYVVFCAIFFKEYANYVMLFLYFFGFIVALGTSYLFTKVFNLQNDDYFFIDLPKYHMPSLRQVILFANNRLKSFLTRATKFIVPLIFILVMLNDKDLFTSKNIMQQSPLEAVGKIITPVFYPMGIKQENWQIPISILTGFVAKEGAIATLQNLYGLNQGDEQQGELNLNYFIKSIGDAFKTLMNNIINYTSVDIIDDDEVKEEVNLLENITIYFNGIYGALAYLVFIMMYSPCASVIGALIKETDMKFALITFFYSTILAYCSAIVFYQAHNIFYNATEAIMFITLAIGIFFAFMMFLKKYIKGI